MKRKILFCLIVIGIALSSIFVAASEFPPGQNCSNELRCAGARCAFAFESNWKTKIYPNFSVYCCGQTCVPTETGNTCTDVPE